MADRLAGARVLVTRPAERAEGLVAVLEDEGAEVIRFPVIAIEPLAAATAHDAARYDMALFVSPAAVEHGLRLARAATAPLVGAVGPGTAAALEHHGIEVAIRARLRSDSEGLLEHPGLAADRVAGRRILIVRGEGGRAHLGASLMARGAAVDYAEVYRRVRPRVADPGAPARCSIVTLTSNEGAENLLALVDERTRRALLQQPLVVAGDRTAQRVRQLGFAGPVAVAGGADDETMGRAVVRLHDRCRQADPGPA